MKAFTLIEVMVAVVILSVMSLTLLQVRNNNTHLTSYFINKNKASSLMSIVSPYYGIKSHNKNLHLDDEVQKEFKIDDTSRKYLKEFNLLYKNKVISTIDLLEEPTKDDEITKEENENEDENEEETDKNLLLAVKVQKISISDKKIKSFFYNLEFE
jgi:prepilin-type N-terminal cleavage/methylation domain-containing protein